MLIRQRVLMTMLQRAGGEVPKLQLMKWAFLLSKETASRGGDSFYQFVPYRYGPYSFSLQQEIEVLIRDGLLEGSGETTWRLTSTGHKTLVAIPAEVHRDVAFILSMYGQLSVAELMDRAYAKYPWFTVNSVRLHLERPPKPQAELAIYTVGYEGLLVDDFLNGLMECGLSSIVDVRNNPISRRYGFHKGTLARLCHAVGLNYHHVPELGIPTESRKDLNSPAHYSALFAAYERRILVKEQSSVRAVCSLVATEPTALVCLEADPNSCHRSRLANALSPLTNLSIAHLRWPR